jgi:hypothetical protein
LIEAETMRGLERRDEEFKTAIKILKNVFNCWKET